MRRIVTAAALTATIAVAFFAHAPAAWSCSCVQRTIDEQLAAAEFVFHGTVQTVDSEAGDVRATLTLDEIFKGRLPATLMVTTAGDEAACGVAFVRGSSYTVFAQRSGDRLHTNACSGTTDDPAVAQALREDPPPSPSVTPTEDLVTVAADDGPSSASRALPLALAVLLVVGVGGAILWRALVA